MTRHIVLPMTVIILTATSARAQDLTCRGVGISAPPPDGVMISLDLVKRDGDWKALHGRIDQQGSTKPNSLVVRGDSLTVRFDQLQATYAGVINAGSSVIRGAWTRNDTRIPLTVRCKPDAPVPDSSPHRVQFVTVQKGVQLELLDWGGTGRPVVLIHGLNVTSHDFDDFAVKLKNDYHVYAITRRGVGRSSAPDTGYSSNRVGEDVVAVLDSLRLEQPVLIGHSLGGAALSNVGSRYPKRVAGLVYLDAAYPYAYVDSARDTLVISADDQAKCPCSIVEQTEAEDPHHIHHIPVPVLAIYATKADWDTRSYDSRTPDWTPAQQAKEFERGVPTARVVRIPNARHDVFRSNETQVLSEIHTFIAGLPPIKPSR